MKRPRLRYSLLTLLIVVTIVGVALAIWVQQQGLVTLTAESNGNRIDITLDRHRLLSITDISLNGETLVWRGDSSWRVIEDDWSGAEWVNTWRPGGRFQIERWIGPGTDSYWGVLANGPGLFINRSASAHGEQISINVHLNAEEDVRIIPVIPLRLFLTRDVTQIQTRVRVTGGSSDTVPLPLSEWGTHLESRNWAVPTVAGERYPRSIPFCGAITLMAGQRTVGDQCLRINHTNSDVMVLGSLEWDGDRGCPVLVWRDSHFTLNRPGSPTESGPGNMAESGPGIAAEVFAGFGFTLRVSATQLAPEGWAFLGPQSTQTVLVGLVDDMRVEELPSVCRPYPAAREIWGHNGRTLTLTAPRGGSDTSMLYPVPALGAMPPHGSGEYFEIDLPSFPHIKLSLEATRCLDINWLTDPDGAIGLTPEILIPVENGDTIHASPEGQGLLLTARVARDATPGVVSGEILFNGKPIPIQIEIADFQLPERPTLRSAFELYGWNLNDQSEESLRRWAAVFADNRLSITYPRPPSGEVSWDGDVIADWSGFEADLELMIDELGMTTFFIPSGMRGHHADEADPRGLEFHSAVGRRDRFGAWPMYLREMRQRLEERGWLDEAVLFLWDEPNATEELVNTYETCAGLIEEARAEMPDTPIYISTTDVIPELEAQWPSDVRGAANMSALQWASIEDIESRPRWLTLDGMVRSWITGDLSGPRAAPLIAWAFGLEGIELWSVNAWHDERAWNPGLLATIDTSSFEPIGPVMAAEVGGILLYQDEQGRPLRSLTWVALGQGMEDVELVEALRSLDPEMANEIADRVRNEVRQTGSAAPLSEEERSRILSAL